MIAGVEFTPKLVVAMVVFLVPLVLARLAGGPVVRVARTVDSEKRKLPGWLTTIASIVIRALGLGYEEDVARAQDVFLTAIKGVQDVLDDPAPAVYCISLGSSTVEMAAYSWIDQTRSSLFEVTSQAVQALKEPEAHKGMNLPYPIRTIRLCQLAEAKPL